MGKKRVTKGRLPALPRKLWKLAQVAYDDLQAVRRSPSYIVGMHRWHMPGLVPGTCKVCLAGAVMAKTLRAPKNLMLNPSDYPPATYRKLLALDNVRGGDIGAACSKLGITTLPSHLHWWRMPMYEYEPTGFMSALKSLIAELKKENV